MNEYTESEEYEGYVTDLEDENMRLRDELARLRAIVSAADALANAVRPVEYDNGEPPSHCQVCSVYGEHDVDCALAVYLAARGPRE